MNKDTLYYSNSGRDSTITRELISNVFQSLSRNLSSESFCCFVSGSRVPNERELYGVFLKSIIEACDKNHLGHIATEFQVERGEDLKGRVDLLFDYRSVSYLVELKVGRVNAKGADREPKRRAKEIWHKAIDQLNELNINSVDSMLRNRIVKLPIALYFYDTTDRKADGVNHRAIHTSILDYIKVDSDNNELMEFHPDFSWYSEMQRTPTRLRKTGINEDINNFLFGFSIFAKQLIIN